MAHYAFLDENNIVTEVIVGKDETDTSEDWEQVYGEVKGQVCKRTSYNTHAGAHINGGTPYRGNYAGIGMKYDENLDAFIAIKPYPSWTLNNYIWHCPVSYPDNEPYDQNFEWNEDDLSWDLIS
tara:strand:- start:1 stop:372 length:372 start_codon:yes stop_codon:yes gene_type:complete